MALIQSKSATGTSGTSLTVTLNSATTAGNCLVVCVGTFDVTDNPQVTGITLGGSAGNFAVVNTAYNDADINAAIWADLNCAGGQTSVVISFGHDSGGSPLTTAWVMEWSGLTAADKTPAGVNGVSASWSSGSTGTLAQASEVAIGVIFSEPGGTLTTPGSPWTELGQLSNSGNVLGAGYQAVSATTALTYNGTTTASGSYGAVIATFKSSGGTAHAGTAALSGSGTLGGAGVLAGTAALSGSGTLSGTGTSAGFGSGAQLSGSGTLGGTVTGTFLQSAVLTGTGTLGGAWTGVLYAGGPGGYASVYAATYPGPPGNTLSGTGSLQLPGVVLGYRAGLSGTGTLSILQATGGLVFASPGTATPQAYPLSSQVMIAPPGTQSWVPIGSVGAVTALTYSFTCPGGCDQMTATVMVPASYRNTLFNPGWQVKITRGGHQVWDGKLDEGVPTTAGWNLTAVGTGNRGQDFLAVYTDTWPAGEPDEAVNNAISRGLPWVNPGIGTPSGAWFGQAVDSGAQTITALLNLVCTRGAYTWYVNSQPGGYPGDDLSVFPLPSVPSRLLMCTTPVARTLGGDINTIFLRYEVSADTTTTNSDGSTTSVPAVYALTSVQNAQSVAAHGALETYIDLSDVGVMTAAAAQAVGSSVMAIYQRASFAGPFTGHYGQLMTTGGVPIDPGTDQAGSMVKLILTDWGMGGEVQPQFPLTFITGSYTWDDFAQQFSAVPYVDVDQSLTGLLSLANTLITPITVASS